MSQFDRYIDEIVKDIDCSEIDKKELKEELSEHLNLLKKEYIDQGFSEEEAFKMAVSNFGNPSEIGHDLSKAMTGGFNMMKIFRFIIPSVLLMVFGSMCIQKFLDLMNLQVDGDGIGIYFLGIEIFDSVHKEYIMNFAFGFLVSGLLAVIISAYLIVSVFIKRKKQTTIQ